MRACVPASWTSGGLILLQPHGGNDAPLSVGQVPPQHGGQQGELITLNSNNASRVISSVGADGKDAPEKSDRQVANALGVHQTTVGTVLSRAVPLRPFCLSVPLIAGCIRLRLLLLNQASPG